MNLNIPYLETDNKLLNDAYRIAAGDIVGNIVYYQNGLLTEEKPCMIAGLDYIPRGPGIRRSTSGTR